MLLIVNLLPFHKVVDAGSDGSDGLDIPDGLTHFRSNLEELFVDICQLLGSGAFVQKVLFIYYLRLFDWLHAF